MLEKELAYYEKNKENLRKEYLGRYIVIANDAVIGGYESDEAAYAGAMAANLEPGAFMIRLVSETEEERIQRFTSLVYV
jgi:hypothetical protein